MKFSLFRNIIFVFSLIGPQLVSAENENMMKLFKNCGLGILSGAALGTVFMATQDKPNDHTQDVAKGASLGLYGGLIYSYYQFTTPPAKTVGIDVTEKSSLQASPLLAIGKDQFRFGIISQF